MMASQTKKVGKRGAVVLPLTMRRQFGIKEGSLIIAEARKEGILIRPAGDVAGEMYTDKRRAEVLLSNAVDARDYSRAVRPVLKMGLNPNDIPHQKPPGVCVHRSIPGF